MRFLIFICFALIHYSVSFALDSHEISTKYVPAINLNTSNGLITNKINKIIQDESGFIWIATDKGLIRYDSENYKHYSKDKSDPFSIPGKQIERIIRMPNNEIWLSIFDIGLVILDTNTGQFTYKNNSNSEKFNLPNNNFFDLTLDKNGNTWLPLYGKGLFQWNREKNKYTTYLTDSKNAWFTSTQPYKVFVDSNNKLWVSTIDAKVFSYSIDEQTSQVYTFEKPIYDLAESSSGEIYAGGYEGLFKFDTQSNTFKTLIDQEVFTKHYGEHSSVSILLSDSKNNLWIATTSSIMLYKDGILQNVNFYQNSKHLQSDFWTLDLFEDSEGGIWISTTSNGLYKLAPSWDIFATLVSNKAIKLNIDNAFSLKAQLYTKNIKENIINNIAIEKSQIIIKNKIELDKSLPILSVSNFDEDEIWLIMDKGVSVLNLKQNNKLDVVKAENGKELEKLDFVLVNSENRVFYSIYGESKLGYIDKTTKIAHQIEDSSSNLKGNKLFAGFTRGNEMWLLTNFGIESSNIETNKFSVIKKNTENWVISSIKNINQDTILIIANGSLYKFTIIDGELVKQKSELDNLFPKVELSKLSLFEKPYQWIRTLEQGVIRLNMDTLAYEFLTEKEGLPSNDTLGIYKIADKKAIVTNLGVSIIQKNIEKPKVLPNLIIESITHNQKLINPKSNENFTLSYNYGVINFKVALLSFSNSPTREYQYKLVGASDKWIGSDSNTFSFLNLNAGDYTFKVKGRSDFGLWSNTKDFSFKIKPPLWKTTWAYLFYVFIIISIFFWLLYLYKRKLRYEHEIQRQQVKKELANAASKAKSDFLARVSHEVRTPLNGILGMSELMIDSGLNSEQELFAESITTSGEHLLEIINDILDLSKIEAGKLVLEEKEFNLKQLVNEVTRSFQSQAQQKNLQFNTKFDENLEPNRLGDVVRLKQILFNLLSNAFKFTEKGKISLKVKAQNDNLVEFILKDTGIGIAEEKITELFSPFTQADSSTTRKYGGTGLGLAIVKQIVEMMHGSISVKSKIKKGTTFTIVIELNQK